MSAAAEDDALRARVEAVSRDLEASAADTAAVVREIDAVHDACATATGDARDHIRELSRQVAEQRRASGSGHVEDEYAALVPPLAAAAPAGDALYLDLLKRVLLNVVYHEQSYQTVLSRGERRRAPALAGARFSLADRVAEAQPPRQRTSAGGISPVGAAVLSDTGGTRGGWV